MKVLVIKQAGSIVEVKERDLDSIVGSYSIVDIKKTKEHNCINYCNRIVNINTMRVKVS